MKRAQNQPDGELYLYGGIYLKEMRCADAGTLVPTHRHAWDHLSYVARGAVRVWRDEEMLGDYAAPNAIRIKAGAAHRFLSLVDDTLVLCVHASDSAEIEITAEHQLELED